MPQTYRSPWIAWAALAILSISLSGCTSPTDYVRQGFKVGPNYCRPPAPVAQHWIDQADIRTADPETVCRWWFVFQDPKLDELIACAYRQNLSLKEAGFRILQARAALTIETGNLFPQQQDMTGSYRRSASAVDPASPVVGPRFGDRWNFGFDLGWELDFWGRFRRAIAAADAQLDASVADYDGVLVTLLGDIAANYVQVRTDHERIALLRGNVQLQQGVLNFIETRLKAGFRQTKLDLDQAISDLRQTEAVIPQLEIETRQAENRLCTLLGIPTIDLAAILGQGPIPTCPPEVAVGMPADLLRRRPDVRRAERLAAAQAEEIGIATADFYPAFTLNGTLGYSARNFPDLFKYSAFNGSVGPSFQWNLLNYGRILGNVRLQDARFQELVATYQNTVLRANEEVENGLITFLRAQQRTRLLNESVLAARSAVDIVIAQYEQGAVDFNRYAVIQRNLVTQQDAAAQAHGQIAQGLISVYRALGGGWEIRFTGGAPEPAPTAPLPEGANNTEPIPAPEPTERIPEPPGE